MHSEIPVFVVSFELSQLPTAFSDIKGTTKGKVFDFQLGGHI